MTLKAPQVKVPDAITPGEDVMIRTKAWHPMETGWRKDQDGQNVPRNRIHTFKCLFEGETLVEADFYSGVSENPYLTFYVRLPGAGLFTFEWHADDGQVFRAEAAVALAAS